MKKILALALTAAMLLSISGCAKPAANPADPAAPGAAGTAPAGNPIVIGVVAPLSGGAAMVGDTLVKGVDLAVKELNAAGGINGRPVQVVKEDDEQNPAKSVSATNKLVHNDKVSAVIGPVNSSCVMASMEVTWAAEIPQITPIASGPSITHSGNDFIARVQASDLLMADAITKHVVNDLGLKKVAILYQSDDYGTGGKDVAVQVLKDAGLEAVAVEAFDPNATDMNSQLLNVKKAEAECIIMWTMYQQGALIAKQSRQMGMENTLLVGGGGLTNAKLYELAGDSAVGILNTQTFFPDKTKATPAAAKFIEAYEKEYGMLPDSNAAMSYDSMMVMAEGLKAAPQLGGKEIMAGIKSVKEMPLATGNITMDENGDANRDILIIKLAQGGKYELVK